MTNPFEESLRQIIREEVRAALIEARSPQPDMVSQAESPLGKRRHCGAVRRRIAAGLTGAAIVGRRHLLSRDALAEELQQAGRGKDRKAAAAGEPSIRDEIMAEIKLLRGGAR